MRNFWAAFNGDDADVHDDDIIVSSSVELYAVMFLLLPRMSIHLGRICRLT